MMSLVNLRAVAAALAIAVLACGGGLPDYDYKSEPDPRSREYVVGVADLLRIDVWRNPELSTEARVRPDGTITVPLIGDITASGKTPTALRTELQSRLDKWLREGSNSVVTVAVTEVNSYRFTVNGEVSRAGVFTAQSYVTLVDAIALAGGFTRYAERDKIVILRRSQAGKIRKIPVDFRAIATGDHTEMNLVILSGDTVIVP